MIRNLLIALVFFFGPTILMLVLRNLLLLLLAWNQVRRKKAMEPHIIDVTPKPRKRAPAWYIVLAVLIGLASAWFAWKEVQYTETEVRQYVPAHLGPDGKIVPGHWEPVRQNPR